MVLFFIVPPTQIGFFVSPIGIAITLFVLFKKINSTDLKSYLIIAIAWTAIAVILDYVLLVKLFQPPDGYYKLDIYFYYASNLILPPVAGWIKTSHKTKT